MQDSAIKIHAVRLVILLQNMVELT